MSLLSDLNARISLNETLELEIRAELEEGRSAQTTLEAFRESFEEAYSNGNELTDAAAQEIECIKLALTRLGDSYDSLEKIMPELEANVQQELELTGDKFKRLLALGEVIALSGKHFDVTRVSTTPPQNMWINDAGKIRTPVDRINSFDRIVLSCIEIRDSEGHIYELEQVRMIVKIMGV